MLPLALDQEIVRKSGDRRREKKLERVKDISKETRKKSGIPKSRCWTLSLDKKLK